MPLAIGVPSGNVEGREPTASLSGNHLGEVSMLQRSHRRSAAVAALDDTSTSRASDAPTTPAPELRPVRAAEAVAVVVVDALRLPDWTAPFVVTFFADSSRRFAFLVVPVSVRSACLKFST